MRTPSFSSLLLVPTTATRGKHPMYRNGSIESLRLTYLILESEIDPDLNQYLKAQQLRQWSEASTEKPELSITPSPLLPRTVSVFVSKRTKEGGKTPPLFMAKFPYFSIFVEADRDEYSRLASLTVHGAFTFQDPMAIRVTLASAAIPEGCEAFITNIESAEEIKQ